MKVTIELTAAEATKSILNGTFQQMLHCEARDEDVLNDLRPQHDDAKENVAEPQDQANSSVPTSTKTYTMDDLAKAGTALMDQGKLQELQAALQSFGVSSLTELTQDQYGGFALKLRELGAQI